jgi:rhodanese-related sulfurtransferase
MPVVLAIKEMPFAKELPPNLAWQLASKGDAIIVDVRSEEEHKFVGHVPNSVLIPWAVGLNLNRNVDFPASLNQQIPKKTPVLFLCRSGKRSLAAVKAAELLGYEQAYSIAGGFEGEIDDSGQRGRGDGWRFHNLPWVQD